MAKKQLTQEQRQAKQQESRERLQKAAEALQTSEGWQRWIETRKRFRTYSFYNTQLIALQCPHATQVAGFKKWLNDFNRVVKKGERAIYILGPIIVNEDVEQKDGSIKQEKRLKGFRGVPVFDVSQTEQMEDKPVIDLDPPRKKITGDTHEKVLAELTGFASEIGYEVAYKELGEYGGLCRYDEARIDLNQDYEPNAQVRVLVHELAHALGASSDKHGRRVAEIIVETVTYMVCGELGLDTSGESTVYVTAWSGGNLDTITEAAKSIDKIATRIEDAISEQHFVA